MNRTTFGKLIVGISLGFCSLAAMAASNGKEIDLELERKSVGRSSAEVSSAARPSTSRPAAGVLPRALVIEVPDVPSKPNDGAGASPDAPQTDRELETRAAVAATWAARQSVDHSGRREIYRAGFYEGLQSAMRDPLLGAWDYRQGTRAGESDPRARLAGEEVGTEDAARVAGRSARLRVIDQFRDLSREPALDPRAAVPAFTGALPAIREPRIVDVFKDHPVESVVAHDFGSLDAWRLYRCDDVDDLYDSGWADASRGFDHWLRHHHDRAFWNQLSTTERARFESLFKCAYSHQLEELIHSVGDRVYARGHEDGWDYGSQVAYEWSFREGFAQGFETAVRDGAETAFHGAYPALYEDRYRQLFSEWSTSARPEIREVALADGNDDGVFEPGEALLVRYELANYGGSGDRFTIRLDGGSLSESISSSVYLPRRQIVRSGEPLAARVDPGVRPHTAAELELTIAGLEHQVPFEVAYPLEIGPRLTVGSRDTLAGRVTIEIAVANISRLPAAGTVQLLVDGGSTYVAPGEIGTVGPGVSHRLAFRITDLDPLDLLAGDVALTAVVRGPNAAGVETVHDQLDQRLPELASDLDNRDLVAFMQEVAVGDRRIGLGDMERAQALMLRRLRVDWQAAVAASGNPYKRDFKRGSRTTALGDLIGTYRSETARMANQEIFTALAPEIEALAESMPGVHPFLRRYMKKLGRELRS
ncbi:MAG: hypothetical protein GY719_10120 [bacterium]|nr:hypothetical protein [bacterium]